MRKYEKPEMELIEYELEDVIRTSGVTDEGTIEENENGNQLPETPFMPRN